MVGHKEAKVEKAAEKISSKRWRVLVVDDCETTTRLIADELSEKGFEILRTTNVDAATKLLLSKKTRPDLVLLDVVMPKIDGVQFCRFIKSNEMFTGIKVVLCSSLEEKDLKIMVKNSGADGYVTKKDVLGRAVMEQLGANQSD